MRARAIVVLVLGLALAASAATPKEQASEILASSGVKGGLVVHLGCGDGRLTAALAASPAYLVHGLDPDEANVSKARDHIRSLGLYGQVSVERFDGDRLPYNANLVNLLVVEKPGKVTKAEMVRVLRPGGALLVRQGSGWAKSVKPWPKNIDQWTHYLHGPDNNAVANDTVVSAPRGIQWVAEPKWQRSHEELASMSVAVTAAGRLFYIIDEGPLDSLRYPADWKLVARDAFNGVLLWKRNITRWTDHIRHFRAGPVHLVRRLVAAGDRVYVTLGLAEPVTQLDAATGKTIQVYKGTEYAEEIIFDRGVLYLVVGTSEVKRWGPGLSIRGEPKPSTFRFICAIEAETGKWLWKRDFSKGEFLLPLSLAVRDGRVFYKTTGHVGCLDARSGETLWTTAAPSLTRRMAWSAPTVVATDEVLLCADRNPVAKKGQPAPRMDIVEWGVSGWNVPGFQRRGPCTLRAYDVRTGKELWSAPCQENYNAPADVFVVGNLVFFSPSYAAHDLKTGKVVRTLKTRGAPVGMVHHRCHRNKATIRYIFTSRSGVELIDLEKGWVGNNSWIRGTCQHGIMPANGLLYAPPDACACFHLVKVRGFFAATTKEGGTGGMPQPAPNALEKGPAYGKVRLGPPASPEDWPLYRHDPQRSGACPTKLTLPLKSAWSVRLGGRLTQPVVAGGRVFIADRDAQTIYALDARDGKELWHFVASGRMDSPPAFYRGLLLFGAADGRVYCLRASDGQLVWRFRAAPLDRRVVAFGRLESIWPVHGAVLVQGGAVYACAGRNSFLDGGLVLHKLEPLTGRPLARRVVYHLDPKTGKQLAKEGKGAFRTFDMEGVRSDVLVGDGGDSVFLRHYRFDSDLKPVEELKPHLFAATSLLYDKWFVRAYWLLGVDVGAGWSGWAFMGNLTPSGWILAFTDRVVYGYGRKEYKGGGTGHRGDAAHLFAEKNNPSTIPANPRSFRGKRTTHQYLWTKDRSLIAKAMTLAGDKLCIAGMPDVARRDPKRLIFDNEDEAVAAFLGKRGVFLQVLSTADGKVLSQLRLPARPIWDSLIAARGRLLIATEDGRLLCFVGE